MIDPQNQRQLAAERLATPEFKLACYIVGALAVEQQLSESAGDALEDIGNAVRTVEKALHGLSDINAEDLLDFLMGRL